MKLKLGSMGSWSLVPAQIKKEAIVSLYLTAAITLVSIIYYFLAQPSLPLFYTLPLPAESLVNKEWIFLFPGLSFIITLLQLILISVFRDLQPLILKLYAWMTSFVQILLLLVVIRIILITA